MPLSDAELITLTLDPSLQVLSLSANAYRTGEGGQAVALVDRSGGSTGTVSVQCTTADGTARAGSDYTTTAATLVFAPGETSKACLVPILNDTVVEAEATFSISLSNPVGARLASPSTATTRRQSGGWCRPCLSVGATTPPPSCPMARCS